MRAAVPDPADDWASDADVVRNAAPGGIPDFTMRPGPGGIPDFTTRPILASTPSRPRAPPYPERLRRGEPGGRGSG